MITHKNWLRFVIIVVTGIALFPFLPAPAPVAADGIVTNCSNDSQFSALLPQGGTISFNCGGAYTITVSSQKVITTSVSIDGANNGNPIVLSGNGIRRIFSINSGVTVFLSDMTVTNGRATNSNGGNILNAGTLYLTDVTVSNGQATTASTGAGGKGGAIYNTGSLIIRQSTISGNTASANLTSVSGDGGGIYSTGPISITNSTLSGNSADDLGGGIVSSGAASSLLNDTLANNVAADGGNLSAGGSLTLKNTILAGGGGSINCSSTTTFTSQGHNLSNDASCSTPLVAGGDLNSTPANLGALANNGGQTKTHLPQAGSSAINNGMNSGCPPDDQRHVARPQGGTCDIGSVEVTFPAVIGGLNPSSRAAGAPGFTLTVNGSNFEPSSQVLWNGSPRPTSYVNSSQLAAAIPASDVASVGSATVTVQNPSTSTSNGLSFNIFELIATITSLVPDSRAAGTAGFTLTVNGSNFELSSQILWNGSPRPTSDVNGSQLTASIPASDLASVGSATVTVQNPSASASNGLSFNIFEGSDTVGDCSEYGLDAALFNGGTITFNCGGIGSTATITISTQKVIGSDTTMDGGNKVSISGGGTTGIFSVTAGTQLALANLTLSNGNVNKLCYQITDIHDGGAVQNAGTLSVTNVSFTSNLACNGGAVDNRGTATVTGSGFIRNTAGDARTGGYGGAIINRTSMTVTNSQFMGNVADNPRGGNFFAFGGGIANGGILLVIGSTFTGNLAVGDGGGVGNYGRLLVTGSTFTDNRAFVDGGAVKNNDTQIVSTSFFTGNVSNNGGGINNRGTLSITASAMAYNSAILAGGGVDNDGTLLVIGSTFTGNRADNFGGGGIDNGANANIDNSTFTGNSAASFGGGIYNRGNGSTLIVSASRILSNTAPTGGGLNNDGIQIVSTSFFTGNMASVGGGINNRGTLSITASAIAGNIASAAGGGIFNDASLLVYTSTFVSNNAPNGGGIANRNALTITGSTLSANVADSGAGISSTGTLAVNASTFNLNSASLNGGGIENADTLAVTNSTFSANSAGNFGGGIDSSNSLTQSTTILNSTFVTNTAGIVGGSLSRNGGPIFLKNTIVAYSTLENCAGNAGNFTTLGHNLDTGTSCNFTAVSDLSNTDPKLGPLQDHGGPTLTHALLRGSPAIDAGDNAGCPGTDQRGVARPLDGNGDGVAVCDIGAYEANQLFRLLLPLIRR